MTIECTNGTNTDFNTMIVPIFDNLEPKKASHTTGSRYYQCFVNVLRKYFDYSGGFFFFFSD